MRLTGVEPAHLEPESSALAVYGDNEIRTHGLSDANRTLSH